MNDRAKQIMIVLIAARLIPWLQKIFGVTLTVADVGDLLAAGVIAWHSAAASWCAIARRYFPPPPANPTEPPQAAKS